MKVFFFFHLDQPFYFFYSLSFIRELKMKPTIIFSNSNNCNIIDTHRLLFHIRTTITYFWLKSKIYAENTNNDK